MKTKEEIENEICDIMIKHGPDGHSDGSDYIADFVIEYAKQQAIAFMKWNAASIKGYVDYIARARDAETDEQMERELNIFEGAGIELRYKLFIESQNK